MAGETMIGVVVSKLESHRGGAMRGYIAMLAVKEQYRSRGIGMIPSPPLCSYMAGLVDDDHTSHKFSQDGYRSHD
jgi:hypothetical protein